MKEYLKPTIWKIIAAIIISLIEVHYLKVCWVFGNSTMEVCNLAPILIIIALPLFLFLEPTIDVMDRLLQGYPKEILIYIISFLVVYFIINIISWELIKRFRRQFGTLSLFRACRTEINQWNNRNFLLALIIGSILMIVLRNFPIIGPVTAGFVAGIIAGKNGNGESAGFFAGIAGSLFFVNISAATNFGLIESVLRIVLINFQTIFLYYGIMGIIGGAIGGFLMRKYYGNVP